MKMIADEKQSAKHVNLKMTGQDGSALRLRLSLRERDSSSVAESGGQAMAGKSLESLMKKVSDFVAKEKLEFLNSKGTAPAKCESTSDSRILLKAVGLNGTALTFQINKKTQLRKLMNVYCERMGVKRELAHFFYNWQPILESDTAGQLDMKDGDTMYVFQQQVAADNEQNTDRFSSV